MAWDKVWEKVFQQQVWGKYPSEDLIRFIARNFYQAPNRKDIKILEIGCGPGANLWFIAREGFTVYGIEGSETAVLRAQQRLNAECPDWAGEIKVGDLLSLPYADNTFDAVIDHAAVCCNSFEDAKIMYAEAYRVLKNSGKLLSRTLAVGCYGDGTGRQIGHNAWIVSEGPLLNKGLARFTDRNEIPELMGKFTVEEINLLTRTVDGLEHIIKEWLIVATKE